MVTQSSWHPPGNSANLNPAYNSAFREWLEKPVGKRLLDLESKRMNLIVPTLFGYDSVLIGEPAFTTCMQASTIKNHFIVNNDINVTPNESASLVTARQDQLPIGSALIDLVYLAHCLEFSANPHEVLREAYRILRADGHLIITMFNPLSVWGVWRSLARARGQAPWKANFMSIVKLKDWLALLGFDIMQVHYFGFNLPLNKSNFSSKLSLFEGYAQRVELPFGAAYLIEASKRVIPLTPVSPAWRAEPDLIEDVTEPTA